MKRLTITALLSLNLIATAALAQQQERLTVGTQVARPIALGQKHSYPITLVPGRFVAGEVMQIGIDLQVAIVGPAGDTIQKFDSPNGNNGVEPFSFTSKTGGTYTVVVGPFSTATGSGRYTLELKRILAAATTPAGKVDELMANVSATSPGVIAAVVRDGKIVYQKGWGLANLTHNVPFTVNTVTNIGSTSKQFTAFAIVMLAGQNKLSLDDDIRKHIPELPDLGQTVTIRHLLTHTSGYREFLNWLALTGRLIDLGDHVERTEIIELLKRQTALQNAPGAEFNYNNSGFSLLATVVERVGGKPFPEWMSENVFQPLGMKNTYIRTGPGQIIPNSSQGYVPVPGGFREAQDIGASVGAGGIYTTLADLAAWMRNFRTGTVGPRGFFEQMTTRNILTTGDTSAYGLGFFVQPWRGLKRVHHGGADIAHRSAFQYFPELDAGVIVQSNNSGISSEGYANQIAEIFFADRLDKKPEAPIAAAPSAFNPATLDSTRLDAYTGDYALTEAPAFILKFMRRDGRFLTQATGQPEIELTATSDSTFVISRVNAQVTFHREPDGSVKRITLNQNGIHPATRVGAAAATKPDFAQFAGQYYSEELETTYRIEAAGDSLTVRIRRMPPVKLNHAKADSFTGSFPVANITFERDAAGKVTGFKVGNSRTRDVVFRKMD